MAFPLSVRVPAAERRRAFTKELADPRRAIISPRADLLLIYGSPLWALLLTHSFLALPFVNDDVTIGEPTTILAFVMGSITFAHLLPVFVRSHINPTIRRTFRFRLFVVPPLLVGLLTVWPAAFVVAGVVAAFWDPYHTAQQNFGLGRIYDSRAGVVDNRARRADRMISHALYLGPILAGPSLMDHLGELESLNDVNWTILARTPSAATPWVGTIRVIVISVMAIGVGAYLLHARRLSRLGVTPSTHKVVLVVSSAVIQIAAWGFTSPLAAFMIVNLYHAVQYFALVWHLEGRKTAGWVGIRNARLTTPIGVFAVFLVPAAFGAAVSGIVTGSAFVNAAFLSVSLLHFWMDGFIWSVRAKAV
jgi:hypothetical protein